MKDTLAQLLSAAIASIPELADHKDVDPGIDRARDLSHGDFASNIAMRLAKPAGMKPRDLAEKIVAALPGADGVAEVSIAGPGFINFKLAADAGFACIATALEQGSRYGYGDEKKEPRYLVEYVSANPTGPLHVGHGRHAAYGATLGNLLEAAGYPVHREYYVNDAGRQMDILGVSVWLRWLADHGVDVEFPQAGYRGEYIRDIAKQIDADGVEIPALEALLDDMPTDGAKAASDATKEQRDELKALHETYVEAHIQRAKTLAGEAAFDSIRQQALDSILRDIKDDLAEFGVTFDKWYSEQSLTTTGQIDAALEVLSQRDMLYKKDGATWFPATRFGDEKDRVVVRENGVKTYFASDIAYHFDKRERDFDHLIDVLGADHHGYVSRVRGGLEAMGYSGDDLEVELVQFVSLYRGGEKMQMSTRSGQFDTLRKLRAEVGNDAARFYYVMRSNDQHLDFDLDIATSQSNDNPVYYIQYAHARIARVFSRAKEQGFDWDQRSGSDNLSTLVAAQEKSLMSALSRYPEILQLAAKNRAPQTLVHYLRDLVSEFHSSYNAHKVLVEDANLRNARLTLYAAVRIVVANALAILGVSAPDEM